MKGRTNRGSPGDGNIGFSSILLAAVVLASPLLVGGVHAGVAAGIAAGALGGLWWHLMSPSARTNPTEGYVLSIPSVLFAFLAIICLVQLLPLPRFLYGLLQPVGMAALEQNWQAIYGEPVPRGWQMISLDPRQTTGHGLRWIALFAVAALAGQLVRGRHSRRRWLGILLVAGAVITAVGLVQHLSGTNKILGIYEGELGPRSLTMFISTNHASSFFALLAIVAAGYSLDHLRRSPLRTLVGAVTAAAAIALCATHSSDGALLALATGLGILTASVILSATSDQGGLRRRVAAAIALVAFFVAAVVATTLPDEWTMGAEGLPLQDERGAEVRLSMARSALSAVGDAPLLGMGAGSTERSLAAYIDWELIGPATVPTVENEPAEWAATLGVIPTAVILLVFALLIFRTLPQVLRRKGRRGASLACALTVFMGVVALFHFPMMTLGIAVVWVVALEAALDPNRDRRLYVALSRRAMILLVLALTVAVGGLLGARATTLSPGPEATLEVEDEAAFQRALRLYPTDGVLLSAKSLHLRRNAELERSLLVARQAYKLRPHPQQHYLLATTLAQAGHREEAAHLYRDLFDGGRQGSGYFFLRSMPHLLFDLPTTDLRVIAIGPTSTGRIRQINQAIVEAQGPFEAIDFNLTLAQAHPDHAPAHLELIHFYRNTGQVELAEIYARMLINRDLLGPDGERPAGLRVLMRLLDEQDRRDEARALADRAFATGHGSPELGRAVLALLPADPGDDDDRHRRLFDAALEVGCVPPYDDRESALCWQARAFFAEADGDFDDARRLLDRIERLHGDPRPLGAFLARQGNCRELSSLRREYSGQRPARFLDRQAARCAETEP